MICIFSTQNDYSTTEVIRWLEHLGEIDVLRVNSDDTTSQFDVHLDINHRELSFYVNRRQVRLNDLDVCWYRKGEHWICNSLPPHTVDGHSSFSRYLGLKLVAERDKLSEYVHSLIYEAVGCLGSPFRCDLNKLLVLNVAHSAGLSVPMSHIVSRVQQLKSVGRLTELITKPMSDVLYLFDKDESCRGYFSYTEELTPLMIEQSDEYLAPSFVQARVKKKFDVRVFYLDGQFYSMAILSQADFGTQTDFRRYSSVRLTRCIPFELPSDIETRLISLFRALNLNTGSVDLVVAESDEYFFLEINPVGQFGMMSQACNYHLEEKVALKLIEYAKRTRERRSFD